MNINKVIYDFEEFQSKMEELEKKSNGMLKEHSNDWVTECGLPIKHYSIGSGKKHIVILGAYHGLEIISTEFLVYTINDIINKKDDYKDIFKQYTLDFIPVVNPEGYVITTTAIRKLIPRKCSLQEVEKIATNYKEAYKYDEVVERKRKENGLDSDHKSIKEYQKMFENVTYNDIPDKYLKIKKKLKELYEKFSIPKGTMISWAANANGIDLNANTKYNRHLNDIKDNKDLYLSLRYSNIKYSNPGPMNCPWNKEKEFELEKENTYIWNYLEELYLKNELTAIFNYHSAGALIDHRPSKIADDLKDRNINLQKQSLNNYVLAKIYQSKTYSDKHNPKGTRYTLLNSASEIGTQNGLYRTIYPLDILIELSSIVANPLGPYSDLENDYQSTMESNFNALIKSIRSIDKTKEMTENIYNQLKNKKINDNDFIEYGYDLIDSYIKDHI